MLHFIYKLNLTNTPSVNIHEKIAQFQVFSLLNITFFDDGESLVKVGGFFLRGSHGCGSGLALFNSLTFNDSCG